MFVVCQGTKDQPTIIHAMDNYRMVGCVCNEEDTNIKWTWLSEVCVTVVCCQYRNYILVSIVRDTPRDVNAATGWSSSLTLPLRSIISHCNLFTPNLT